MSATELTLDLLAAWLRRYAELVGDQKAYLTELDSAIGDADHGTNMARGTAAVVAPIGVLKGTDFIDEQPLGELALSLREELTDIQYGRREDTHGWLVRLDG